MTAVTRSESIPVKFITFREEKGWTGSEPIVGFVSREIIEALWSKEELSDAFEGYLEYEQLEGGQRFFGVWGHRNTAKLRRLLRERGAKITIERLSPALFRQRHRASR